MQAKARYCCALVGCVIVLACVIALLPPRRRDQRHRSMSSTPPPVYTLTSHSLHESAAPRQQYKTNNAAFNPHNCSMHSCFDFMRCLHGFTVYVYDIPPHAKLSDKYKEILNAIRSSRFYTSDSSRACIFVLPFDTLDRDKLSTDYVKLLEEQIQALPLWNNGKNHLIFNLYSGTWPDYDVYDLSFDVGLAMLAQASMPLSSYRTGYDISFPLYHDDHPAKAGQPGYLQANTVPPVRQYTISFKGKRYVFGIGSDSRNALYHIHNGKDIILVTTCKHKGTPKHMYDARCEQDEQLYDMWDYKVLMHNSTFCLVPRGRRLASYRFLESLQAGCIPVLLSNEYVLPFSDVIDWSRSAIWADERLLLQIPSLVRSISHVDILALRQQSQFLWNTYFSSVHHIVHTTLEILAERVARHLSLPVRSTHVWNTQPGALNSLPEYSSTLAQYPFYAPHPALVAAPSPSSLQHLFTAVITTQTSPARVTSPLYRLIKNLAKSSHLHQIVLLWRGGEEPPPDVRWAAQDGHSVPIIVISIQSDHERYRPFAEIQTAAVLALDEHMSSFTADQADFGFSVWQEFPDRIVGYTSRAHYWHEARQTWAYSSRPQTHYSLVLPPAFYHKYYGHLLYQSSSPQLLQTSSQHACHDLLLNFVVSSTRQLPPIRLVQHTSHSEPANSAVWRRQQRCMHELSQHWGTVPLVRSQVRVDPLLYRDDVSMLRKKYRQFERLPSAFSAA